MVNRREKLKMKEQTRKALDILNHKTLDFTELRNMNNSGGNYDSNSSSKSNTYVLKGGSSNLSAYGGPGGVIDCQICWDNKLPADAFIIETNS